MTIHVNIGEAKTRLSELVAAAKRGEEVIIAKAGQPVARLEPIDAEAAEIERRMSAFGMFKDAYDPDMIDALLAPLTEEELAEWYDGPLFPPDNDDDEPAA